VTNTLHKINHVTFVMEMDCVLIEAGVDFLNVILGEWHVPV
jgi:hypothetical protein